MSKKVTVVDFCDIFNFATEVYGIHWNPCNDLFFGNAFEYRQHSDFSLEYYPECCDDLEDEGKLEALFEGALVADVLSKEEVLALSKGTQSYLITAHFLQAKKYKGSILIDST